MWPEDAGWISSEILFLANKVLLLEKNFEFVSAFFEKGQERSSLNMTVFDQCSY